MVELNFVVNQFPGSDEAKSARQRLKSSAATPADLHPEKGVIDPHGEHQASQKRAAQS